MNKKIKTTKLKSKRWKYQNTALLIVSASIFIYLASTPTINDLIHRAGSYGYIGALVTGFLSVSTFTVAPALLVLFNLAENLHILELAVLAGLGAMIGDYLVFNVTKNALYEELKPLFSKVKRSSKLKAIARSRYFAWTVPLVGALIIAFPLFPDEVGLSILGLSHISKVKFFILTFVLNCFGLILVLGAARL